MIRYNESSALSGAFFVCAIHVVNLLVIVHNGACSRQQLAENKGFKGEVESEVTRKQIFDLRITKIIRYYIVKKLHNKQKVEGYQDIGLYLMQIIL